MSLAEEIVKEQVTQTPERYGQRVWWMVVIYLVLDTLSIVIALIVAWRVQYFITLSQRTNVETLTLAIIFILAIYYLVSTAKAFVGSLKVVWYNLPALWSRNDQTREQIEKRKNEALKRGGKQKSAYFDKAVVCKERPDEPIQWDLQDDAGELGVVTIQGVQASLEPKREGVNNSVFEFVASRIQDVMKQRDPNVQLQITQWSTIDQDQASAYYSLVSAFDNLKARLGSGRPIWPTLEITQAEIDQVGQDLKRIMPHLRNEAFMPDLEYAVEYSVPILPEPLGFMKLTRSDNRADPIISMGCAGIVMLFIMGLLLFFIVFPPWIPAR